MTEAYLPQTPSDHGRLLHPAGALGTVVLAWREGTRWRELAVSVEDLPEALDSFAGRLDAYMTQNRFHGRRRRVATLAQLDAIYCDVDYYKVPGIEDSHPWQVMEAALDALAADRMPSPSLAIATGRGLSLLWLHYPVPRKALPRWNACQRQVYDTLKHLGADPLARDAARVLRLIGTKHSKTDRIVEALTPPGHVWQFDDLADELLPLTRAELYDLRIQRALRRAAAADRIWTPPQGFTAATLWESRLADLQLLLTLRWFGQLPPGHRNAWILAAGMAMGWLAEPRILRRELTTLAEQVTAGDWSEAETRSSMASVFARAAAAAKGEKVEYNGQEVDPRYRVKTATLLDWLDITTEEQRQLQTLIGPDVRRERRRARWLQDRAAAGGVDRDTYLEQSTRQTGERREAALRLREEGLSVRAIAERLEVTPRRVYQLLAGDVLADAAARGLPPETPPEDLDEEGYEEPLGRGLHHHTTAGPFHNPVAGLEDLEAEGGEGA